MATKTFEVSVPVSYWVVYTVTAEDEKEARFLVDNGEWDDFYDTEHLYNEPFDITVEEVEGDEA